MLDFNHRRLNPIQEQEIISVYCLCRQLQSRRILKCSVCGEEYLADVKRKVSIFLLSRLQEEKIEFLHMDADLLSLISSHLSSYLIC